MKFSIKDFYSKSDQIRSLLRIGQIYWRNPYWKTYFFASEWFGLTVLSVLFSEFPFI